MEARGFQVHRESGAYSEQVQGQPGKHKSHLKAKHPKLEREERETEERETETEAEIEERKRALKTRLPHSGVGFREKPPYSLQLIKT